MSRDALKTLFHPFASGTVAIPSEGERILFLGAEAGFSLPDGFGAALTACVGLGIAWIIGAVTPPACGTPCGWTG